MAKKPKLYVTVFCANCRRQFELDSRDWDKSRKPWCTDCRRSSLIGNRFIPRNDQDLKTKRNQARANRRWFRQGRDEQEGVISVKKDWKEINVE